MRDYAVTLEPWNLDLWAEVEALTIAHFEEVDGGVEPNRPFKPDQRLLALISEAGAFKVIIAREAGKLIGYFTWNITPDVESEGLLIGQQGAWYVAPGHPCVALTMFRKSVEELRALGVQCIYPHHRTQGRGAHLGRFFKRQGAKEIQHTYSMWIGA